MIANNELEQLISVARQHGAIIRTKRDTFETPILEVQVRSGIPGVGRGWMPPIQAADQLLRFVAEKGA